MLALLLNIGITIEHWPYYLSLVLLLNGGFIAGQEPSEAADGGSCPAITQNGIGLIGAHMAPIKDRLAPSQQISRRCYVWPSQGPTGEFIWPRGPAPAPTVRPMAPALALWARPGPHGPGPWPLGPLYLHMEVPGPFI